MSQAQQRMWVGHALIGLVCLTLLALIGRLSFIHVEKAPQLQAYSEARQRCTVSIPGRRGMILDRRQRVLAGSYDRPTVFADPRYIENREETARQLAVILHKPAAEILEKLEKPTSPAFVILAKNIAPSDAKDVESLDIRGINTRKEPAREYPMGKLAAHVLGFVGRDGSGLDGVEMMFERYLKATKGKRVVYRDRRRRASFQEPNSYVAPQDGLHVVLTIDAEIQDKVEEQVSQAVEHFKAESGVGIVMDPKTGEVLAITSYPTFEPARANTYPADARRNRALTDPVEPGSCFKPYTMAAALADGLTTPNETIYCHDGLFKIGGRLLHDHHPYGNLTTTMGMVKSSNILMAILGLRLGNERMYEAFRNFGFGAQTGIDLPGEGEGLLMPLSKWNSYSTTSVPMGQELAITPIQLATAFCSLVNGGRLLKPRVVAAVTDAEGHIVEDYRDVHVRGQSIDPATAQTMVEILSLVVNEGTGRNCKLDKWQALGKTGTAQVPRKGARGYEPNAYLGSFIGSAPASNPDLVALVMIRKPDRRIGYYGSTVAAPAVKAILEHGLTYRNVPADLPAPGSSQELARSQ
jgi:cell division protein FtsI/penicillin-binding protein 2